MQPEMTFLSMARQYILEHNDMDSDARANPTTANRISIHNHCWSMFMEAPWQKCRWIKLSASLKASSATTCCRINRLQNNYPIIINIYFRIDITSAAYYNWPTRYFARYEFQSAFMNSTNIAVLICSTGNTIHEFTTVGNKARHLSPIDTLLYTIGPLWKHWMSSTVDPSMS